MALTVDKFKFGNKSIADMYFGTVPVKEIYFGNTLIWQKGNAKVLVAGDKLVAIEYVPTTDTTVNSIEIYTTSNQGDNNNARVKILHESGLYIAAFNSDNGPDAAEIYHLSGYKRYVNNQSVALKAGKKYYIVYQHDDANPGENTFWPAYFQNENGNYKEYSNNRDTVTTTDISSFGDYNSDISNLDDVFELSENDFFYWTGSTSIMDNALFVRSNKGNGTNYRGILGNDSTYAEITKTDIITWLGYSVNDSYRWSIGGYQNLTWKNYYYKSKSSNGMTQTDLVTGLNSDAEKIATLLMAVKTSGSKTIGIDGPAYWFSISVIGRIFSLKSGFTVHINNLTPVSPSSITPQEGDIYYLAAEPPIYNAGVYLYTNNDWKFISDLTTILNVEYLDTYMTDIGAVSDLTKQKISGDGVISETLRTTQVQTNRKYYLKINGKEV